jgi:hypothetical protein
VGWAGRCSRRDAPSMEGHVTHRIMLQRSMGGCQSEATNQKRRCCSAGFRLARSTRGDHTRSAQELALLFHCFSLPAEGFPLCCPPMSNHVNRQWGRSRMVCKVRSVDPSQSACTPTSPRRPTTASDCAPVHAVACRRPTE